MDSAAGVDLNEVMHEYSVSRFVSATNNVFYSFSNLIEDEKTQLELVFFALAVSILDLRVFHLYFVHSVF
ncbi:MAG: hypothetical protein LBP35_05090 [Candidatus Ancillula trichonymphae]|nr:hypothetical protein [Candidatus Ancillula trichonymphae]